MPKQLANGVTIEKVVLCEEVRQEIGNKHTILGALAGDLNVAGYPAAIRIAAYVDMTATAAGPYTLEYGISFGGTRQAITASNFNALPPNHIVAIIPPTIISLTAAGQLEVEVRVPGGAWEQIEIRKIA